ncbi:MAG TPA: helix-turn-helix domain-containing protein [Candidatus Acidoferrales bacterium]|nr:helix-turn-helix domain-containing protein [Candidatus Acidoferrales bacterium]
METHARPHFGALLRLYRLEAGMTQQDLAERARVSVEAIGALERGTRTRPHRETVDMLVAALALTAESEALLKGAVGIANPSIQRERTAVAPGSPQSNLPQPLTSFVGRERDVAEVSMLLREHRLVTIVGSGGVGKTRVAVRIGTDALPGYPDGVWLVDLASLVDPGLLPAAILAALQISLPSESAMDAVIENLKDRRLLLLLDNCEHVISRARDVTARIMQSCAGVRILSTSREALSIPGERIYRLPSLTFPAGDVGSAAEALAYGAVALFVERALALDTGFECTDEVASEVAEICRRLDGIPLAIELAAARINVLAAAQIAERLDERFRMLTGGDPAALPRHQTMMALIDWSYDLLTAREQRFFDAFSIFATSCALNAATAACAIDGEDHIFVMDLIASLVTKSLLVAESAGGEQRYRFSESTRQYARGKLIARGEYEEIARRHAQAYVDIAEQFEREWDVRPEQIWFAQVKLEVENWRAAFEWTLGEARDVALGQRLAAQRKVLQHAFSPTEARRWIRAALERVNDDTPPRLIAMLEHAQADGAVRFGNNMSTSLAAAERALLLYRELGDPMGCAHCDYLAGTSLMILGRISDGEERLLAALSAAEGSSQQRFVANILQMLGHARSTAGDFAKARSYFYEALALARTLDSEVLSTTIAANLAGNEFDSGDPEGALRITLEALAKLRTLKNLPNMRGIGVGLHNAAAYSLALERYEEARTRTDEALELARAYGYSDLIGPSLRNIVLLVARAPRDPSVDATADYEGAARLLGFLASDPGIAKADLRTRGREREEALAAVRELVGEQDLQRLMSAGATMSQEQALEQARLIH